MKAPRFDAAKVMVVGDAMLDRYWHGSTQRISAEAPIPVVDIGDIEDRPGGAANVALNVVTLGADAHLVAAIGDDENGRILAAKIEGAGVGTYLITTQARTTTKLRIVSQSQQLIRADFEDNPSIEGQVVVNRMGEQLSAIDTVVLSDYDKGLLSGSESIVAAARKAGKPVLVDPKFKPLSAYAGATIIKPNLKELRHAVGDWQDEKDMVMRCHTAIEQLGIEAMLVTRASEGMTLIVKGQEEVHLPARTREVFDVSGAGDTVIATLAAAIASGETLLDATRLANIAAGLVVGHFGITSVSGPELRMAVEKETMSDRGVMSEDQLVIAVQEARSRGARIVFTNGCFDILHTGHLTYLEEARQQGDLLIVGVNGDESVRRLKGESRPINPVEHRMTLLSGLQAVDWVVRFDEDTPESLIKKIVPDVLVKGGDYRVDQVVGGDFVVLNGGEVKVLSLVEDCSTSALVEKIRRL